MSRAQVAHGPSWPITMDVGHDLVISRHLSPPSVLFQVSNDRHQGEESNIRLAMSVQFLVGVRIRSPRCSEGKTIVAVEDERIDGASVKTYRGALLHRYTLRAWPEYLACERHGIFWGGLTRLKVQRWGDRGGRDRSDRPEVYHGFHRGDFLSNARSDIAYRQRKCPVRWESCADQAFLPCSIVRHASYAE